MLGMRGKGRRRGREGFEFFERHERVRGEHLHLSNRGNNMEMRMREGRRVFRGCGERRAIIIYDIIKKRN